MDYDNSSFIQCRQCGEVAASPTERGYLCESCGYLLGWSFFKMQKLRCGCDQCRSDLENEFWKNTPPFDLDEESYDFQI